MELLCLTGVEDKLQVDVKPTLELLRNAGIKVRTHFKQKSAYLQNICNWYLVGLRTTENQLN